MSRSAIPWLDSTRNVLISIGAGTKGFLMLQIRKLTKFYPTPQGKLIVLNEINLDLDRGSSLALMGESGSGKSTLLHLTGGLDSPDAGEILLDGTNIAAMSDRERAKLRRQDISLIFQQFNLVPSLSVYDNIAFQARLAGHHDKDWQKKITGELGLDGLDYRYPEELSGGQQQRVAIGRTLAARPKLILADEPTGNLDEATSDAVLELTLSLVNELGSSLLMVTHSKRVADRLERTCHLRGGHILT